MAKTDQFGFYPRNETREHNKIQVQPHPGEKSAEHDEA